MAFAPIALVIPQYEDHSGWWLKAYSQGTTTPLNMATDATGTTTLVKALLDSEGFPITSSTGPQFTPFIDGDYDLWLFPTEGEADGNITVNAVQLADDLNADPAQSGSSFLDAVTLITANTTIAVTHKDEIVDCTNTITLAFTAAATLGAGFAFVARNKGSGVITCDANSAETINGALTLTLGIGEWAVFICDGVNWSAIVGNSFGGRWVKGADVASTATMTLGADGNYFDITGTTAITSIVTRGATGAIKLHFDGALTFTHHATNLILPGGVNVTTKAGDEIELIEYGSGTYRVVVYPPSWAVKSVANYVGGMTTYIESDIGADLTQLDVDSLITVDTWESVGPTGSGADNIWTPLDVIPSTAKAVLLKFRNYVSGSTIQDQYIGSLFARSTGSSVIPIIQTLVSEAYFFNANGSAEANEVIDTAIVPVDSLARFDLHWTKNGTSPSNTIDCMLVGWLE